MILVRIEYFASMVGISGFGRGDTPMRRAGDRIVGGRMPCAHQTQFVLRLR